MRPVIFDVANRASFYGSLLLFFAVGIGAFGAHGLEQTLMENQRLDVFATANAYHFYHALGLILIGILFRVRPTQPFANAILCLMLAGILLFSGSLYLLSVLNIAWLGVITPVGGLMLLISWALLAVGFWRAD